MEHIWLKSYPAGVPEQIDPDQYPSLTAWLNEACDAYADRVACISLGQTMTYRQLQKEARAFCAYLREVVRLNPGDRVAVMLPNLLQYPVAVFGCLLGGLAVVNVNPLYTSRELRVQLQDAGARVLVVLDHFAHVAEGALLGTFIDTVVVTRVGDYLPAWKAWGMQAWLRLKGQIKPYTIAQQVPWKRAMQEGRTYPPKAYPVTGEDMAFLQYTGGTTGLPKGAVLTHRNMVANVMQILAWVKPVLKTDQALSAEDERVLTALPLYHIFSLTANWLVFTVRGGTNILVANPRDIDSVVRHMAVYQPAVITGVNTLFNALVHHPRFPRLAFDRLRFTVGGGMAVQKAVADLWQQITGLPVIEAYGLTETSPAVTINRLDIPAHTGSVGLPIPSTQVLLLDDTGSPVRPGIPGELCIQGPQVMQAYWQKPEETSHMFHENRWFKTGDMAIMDERGFIRIVDRKKDMILVSGFNVYPNEIENVLAQHPGILEVAVIGVPDLKSSEAVKLFIVRKDPQLTEEKIRAFCRANFTGYKQPKHIEFINQLPKSAVGKVLRRELRQAELQKL